MEKENKNFPKVIEKIDINGKTIQVKQFRDLSQMKTEEAFKLFQKYHAGLSLNVFQKMITNFEFVQDFEKEKNRLLVTLDAYIKVRDNVNRDQSECIDFCVRYKKATPYVSTQPKDAKTAKQRLAEYDDSIADVNNKLMVIKFIESFEKISAKNQEVKTEKGR